MRIITLLIGLTFSFAAFAQGGLLRFTEGVHYTALGKPVETVTPGKIEVTEAFAYTCGHCFNFEPVILQWEKNAPDDVQLVKLPVIWSEAFVPYARAMYAGELLGKSKELNAMMFKKLHVDGVDRRSFGTPKGFAKAVEKELGIDEKTFMGQFNSFTMDSFIKRARLRTRDMNITATPQMIVDGRYSVSASNEHGIGHKEMLEIVDFLIDKVRAEKGMKRP